MHSGNQGFNPAGNGFNPTENLEQPYGDYTHVVPGDLWEAYDNPVPVDDPTEIVEGGPESAVTHPGPAPSHPEPAPPAPQALQSPSAPQAPPAPHPAYQLAQPPTAQPPTAQPAQAQMPPQAVPGYGPSFQQPPTLSAVAPGWYRDPCGETDLRAWNGSGWTDDVMLGTYQFLSPLPTPEQMQLPAAEALLWRSPKGFSSMTTHRIWISESERDRDIAEFPLWAVRRAVARTGVNSTQVEITVGFQGYGGRITWILRNIPDAPVVAAMISRQAAHARLAYYGNPLV